MKNSLLKLAQENPYADILMNNDERFGDRVICSLNDLRGLVKYYAENDKKDIEVNDTYLLNFDILPGNIDLLKTLDKDSTIVDYTP